MPRCFGTPSPPSPAGPEVAIPDDVSPDRRAPRKAAAADEDEAVSIESIELLSSQCSSTRITMSADSSSANMLRVFSGAKRGGGGGSVGPVRGPSASFIRTSMTNVPSTRDFMIFERLRKSDIVARRPDASEWADVPPTSLPVPSLTPNPKRTSTPDLLQRTTDAIAPPPSAAASIASISSPPGYIPTRHILWPRHSKLPERTSRPFSADRFAKSWK